MLVGFSQQANATKHTRRVVICGQMGLFTGCLAFLVSNTGKGPAAPAHLCWCSVHVTFDYIFVWSRKDNIPSAAAKRLFCINVELSKRFLPSILQNTSKSVKKWKVLKAENCRSYYPYNESMPTNPGHLSHDPTGAYIGQLLCSKA